MCRKVQVRFGEKGRRNRLRQRLYGAPTLTLPIECPRLMQEGVMISITEQLVFTDGLIDQVV